MKALLCRRYGPPGDLVVDEIAVPTPGAGEVLVAVKAAGVNFPDALIIENKYQIKAQPPFSPGGELAGIVAKVGAGVTRVRPGQAVIGFTGWGAFAEMALVPEERLVAMPEGMPFEIAGSFLMTYGTSFHALVDRAELLDGETVLVLGAAGGIGLACVEIAKAMGAKVIAAASSAGKLAVCREHGADETIDYGREDLRSRIKEITGGRGVDVVCDPVGAALAEPALRSMAWRGRYLVLGFAGGEIPRLPLNLPLLKGCSIVGVFWGDLLQREPAQAAADLEQLATLWHQGRIRPHIWQRFPLERAAEAIAALVERRVVGKAVIVPAGLG
ncbi:MAG: NADPH:quinone oxidoreductase family protein [Burkholderiales bacterium]|nr:NADPH:quinone oxidoreductase family protein [Burkholderiales bacterium]